MAVFFRGFKVSFFSFVFFDIFGKINKCEISSKNLKFFELFSDFFSLNVSFVRNGCEAQLRLSVSSLLKKLLIFVNVSPGPPSQHCLFRNYEGLNCQKNEKISCTEVNQQRSQLPHVATFIGLDNTNSFSLDNHAFIFQLLIVRSIVC